MALNRLRFHNILVREMDAPSPAASELAEVVDEGIASSTSDQATKQDVRSAVLEMQVMFHEEVNRLLKWVVGAGLTVGAAIIGLLVALVMRGG